MNVNEVRKRLADRRDERNRNAELALLWGGNLRERYVECALRAQAEVELWEAVLAELKAEQDRIDFDEEGD